MIVTAIDCGGGGEEEGNRRIMKRNNTEGINEDGIRGTMANRNKGGKELDE